MARPRRSTVKARLATLLPNDTRDAVQRRSNAMMLRVGPRHVLPDFLGIGCIKGGTTALWHYLSQHEFVAPASDKQLRYFDYFYARGEGWYRRQFPTERSRRAFRSTHGRDFATGEASPSYLSHPLAAGRAAALVPNAKLVVLLRNPIDRAYSHWQHSVRAGRDPITDFEAALDCEFDRIAGETDRVRADVRYFPAALGNFSYQTRGHYAEQLEVWLRHFPREQFFVCKSEELQADPRQVFVEQLCPFLGLPAPTAPIDFTPQLVGGYAEAMPRRVRERLAQHFEPHNERLRVLLGDRFDWPPDGA